MSNDAVRAWANLQRVHARVAPYLDRELQRAHRLPLTWYDVLLELNEAEGKRLTMGELGELAVVTRTRVTRVVDEMESEGLVARVPNPDDARSMFASITRLGRDRLKRATPTYLNAVQSVFGSAMTRADAKTVATAMDRVLATEY